MGLWLLSPNICKYKRLLTNNPDCPSCWGIRRARLPFSAWRSVFLPDRIRCATTLCTIPSGCYPPCSVCPVINTIEMHLGRYDETMTWGLFTRSDLVPITVRFPVKVWHCVHGDWQLSLTQFDGNSDSDVHGVGTCKQFYRYSISASRETFGAHSEESFCQFLWKACLTNLRITFRSG